MSVPVAEKPPPAPASGADASRKHLRGSTVLLVGRVLGMLMNFSVHILTVRLLSREDYGLFAYALTVAALGTSLCLLCLDKTLARFLPLYHERGEYARLSGTVLLGLLGAAGLGMAWALSFLLLQGWLGATYFREPGLAPLVVLLGFLAPLDGLICILGALFAVFARPRDIFVPRHLLGPALQLLLIGLFAWSGGSVHFLAAAYVACSALTCVFQAYLLHGILRREGILGQLRRHGIRVPGREIMEFTVPLLAQDLVFLLRSSLVVVVLERFHGTGDVAMFRAVFPIARLNLMVYETFTVLFMPMAARLYARNERSEINALYWNSAAWMAVLTFPLFAASFSLAGPVAALLFGERYAQSGAVLALLALGHYFTAAAGFNGLTLQVFGRARFLLLSNLAGAALGVALFAVLIPPLGVLGAALATSGTMIGQNLLFQAGLRLVGVSPLDRRYARVYLLVGLAAGGLLAGTFLTGWSLWLAVPAAAAASLLLLRLNRDLLDLEHSFPELCRIPLARRLLGTAPA